MTNYGKTKVKDLPVLISDKSIFCEGGGRLLSDIIYPIGSIYISTVSTNPSEWFGGVWEAFATGRTLVGIDASQTEFNTSLKTGGSKYLQSHRHYIWGNGQSSGNYDISSYPNMITAYYATSNATDLTYSIRGSGSPEAIYGRSGNAGSGDSENLQPYIVVYMWKRIS